jgi:TatD DNase family protein
MTEDYRSDGPSHVSSTIVYKIRNSLYLNITNKCSNICSFCPKFDRYSLKGNDLFLKTEPSFDEVMDAIEIPAGIEEVVFCGFGESLLRLELVIAVAKELKTRYGIPIRINTDGQANLVHGRNIIPELAGLVDCISVSLNAPDAVTYNQICNTPFGEEGFKSVCEFILSAKEHIPQVIATAVTIPGVDIVACRALALSFGVTFRIREYVQQ